MRERCEVISKTYCYNQRESCKGIVYCDAIYDILKIPKLNVCVSIKKAWRNALQTITSNYFWGTGLGGVSEVRTWF